MEQNFSFFFKRVLTLGIPLMFQSLLFSSLGFIDNLMVSQLGTNEVSASGIGARYFWLASIIVWGMGSGMGVLLAQYWGAKDSEGFKKNFAMGLLLSTFVSSFFFVQSLIFPSAIPTLFNTTDATQVLTEQYIQLIGFAILLAGPSITLDASLRSIGKTKVNLYLSLAEILLNVALNFVLIFGHFGFPAMGLIGAGWGTAIARLFRVILSVFIIYRFYPEIAFYKSHLFNAFKKEAIVKYLNISLPIIGGSFIWSAGMFTYHVLLGRVGEVELAAMAILSPLESIALAASHGMSSATAILVGNALGANKLDLSKVYAGFALKSSLIVGIIIATILLLSQGMLLSLYTAVDSHVIDLLSQCFPVIAMSIVLRTINITVIVGLLRAGGDAKFCMNMDLVCQWVWAVPVTAIGAIWLGLPLPVLYFLMNTEELVKLYPAIKRMYGDKWVNNLAVDKPAEA